jgi:CheY-like chemotaxis protein
MTTGSICILQAEDSLGDAQLTRLALSEGEVPHDLHHVRDGIEALQFMRNEPPYADAPRPDLVLLDLNMPRLGGHEVLMAMKNDPLLCTIPVIALTTSNAPNDIARSYELHVNSYVRKPIDFDQFVGVMRCIERFWMETAVLPEAPVARSRS